MSRFIWNYDSQNNHILHLEFVEWIVAVLQESTISVLEIQRSIDVVHNAQVLIKIQKKKEVLLVVLKIYRDRTVFGNDYVYAKFGDNFCYTPDGLLSMIHLT